MPKLCLSCMKSIPLMAGKCPYCTDENQGVGGRIFLLLIFIIGIIFASYYYSNSNNNITSFKSEDIEFKSKEEIKQQLNKKLLEIEGFKKY